MTLSDGVVDPFVFVVVVVIVIVIGLSVGKMPAKRRRIGRRRQGCTDDYDYDNDSSLVADFGWDTPAGG